MITIAATASASVANVPQEEFEEAVESDDPPTVTKLAEQGKKTRPAPADHLKGVDPKKFYAFTPHRLRSQRTRGPKYTNMFWMNVRFDRISPVPMGAS